MCSTDVCTVSTTIHRGTMTVGTGPCGSYPCMGAQTHHKCWRRLRSVKRNTRMLSSGSLDSTTNDKSSASVSLPPNQTPRKTWVDLIICKEDLPIGGLGRFGLFKMYLSSLKTTLLVFFHFPSFFLSFLSGFWFIGISNGINENYMNDWSLAKVISTNLHKNKLNSKLY